MKHSKSKGNGAAIKTGLRLVRTEYVACMDGDGQHTVEGLRALYEEITKENLDLVVGARSTAGQASGARAFGNSLYNQFASWMVGDNVKDLTSGQRIFKTEKVRKIIWMLPNTFSYPTTSTMVFYRLGNSVGYIPIEVLQRVGNSHINLFRDGFRFFLIIMKIGTLFSPFKIFVPTSLALFMLGVIRYIYTFLLDGTFTNMSALLFVSSLIVFLMGVLSEQVSMAIYSHIEKDSE